MNLDWEVVAAVGQCWDICKARGVPAASVAHLLLAGVRAGEYETPAPKPVAVVGAAKLAPEPDTYYPYERLGLPQREPEVIEEPEDEGEQEPVPTPPWMPQDETPRDERGRRVVQRPEMGKKRDGAWRGDVLAWLAGQDDHTGSVGQYAEHAGLTSAAASQRMRALVDEGKVELVSRGWYRIAGVMS